MISQKAIDLIVQFEVSSKNVYEKKYQHPEWPGGASGITVGIGYDLGYQTKAKIVEDWAPYVDADTLKAMVSCAGVKGAAAQNLLPAVKSKITIPWSSAMKVFLNKDVPLWTGHVLKTLPGAEKLSPDSLGALVSLAYNRGASFNLKGDRYSEMRDIKTHLKTGELSKIPEDIRKMKRLWPNMKGLRDRREQEAKLFEQGLKEQVKAQAAGITPLVAVAGTSAVAAGGSALALTQVPQTHWMIYVVIGAAVLTILMGLVAYHWHQKKEVDKNVATT